MTRPGQLFYDDGSYVVRARTTTDFVGVNLSTGSTSVGTLNQVAAWILDEGRGTSPTPPGRSALASASPRAFGRPRDDRRVVVATGGGGRISAAGANVQIRPCTSSVDPV